MSAGAITQIGTALPIPIARVYVQPQFCFIPTTSALDIGGGSVALAPQNLMAAYSGANRPAPPFSTPFSNFITASRENLTHILWNGLNSKWAFQEMQGAPQVFNCQAFCQLVPAISGLNAVCAGSSATYTVNTPANTNIIWDVQPVGLVTSSTSGNAITLTNSAGLAGTRLTIAATIIGECGQLAVPAKSITLGVPEVPALEEAPGCTYNQLYYRIANYDPSQTYTIINRVNAAGPAPGPTFWVKGGSSGSFTLTATNSCGNNSVGNDVVYSNCSGSRTYTISPNPGTDEVVVEEEPTPEADGNDSHGPAAPAGISGVRVYDGYGRLRFEQAARGVAAMRLQVSALPAGLYVVHILSGGKVASRQRLQITR